jgi:hypothetical protein
LCISVIPHIGISPVVKVTSISHKVPCIIGVRPVIDMSNRRIKLPVGIWTNNTKLSRRNNVVIMPWPPDIASVYPVYKSSLVPKDIVSVEDI